MFVAAGTPSAKNHVSFVIKVEPGSEPTIRRAVDAINAFEFMVEPVVLQLVVWSPLPTRVGRILLRGTICSATLKRRRLERMRLL